jgi:carboxymethylenebutenolidase
MRQRLSPSSSRNLLVALAGLIPFVVLAAFAVPAGCARGAAPEKVSFQSNGRTLTMAHWPAEGPGRHPAVLLLHGGGGPELIENDPNYRQYPESLAAAGYAVYMPYYWGSTAPSDENTPDNFSTWVRTARNALVWVNAQPDVQPGRIGAMGLSLGAFLGLAVATEEPGLRALVEFYGGMPEAYAPRMKRMPPTLILHGAKDVLVDVAEAHQLETLFRARGVTYQVHIYPDQNHGFMGAAGPDSARRAIAFLDRYLRPSAPAGRKASGRASP